MGCHIALKQCYGDANEFLTSLSLAIQYMPVGCITVMPLE